MQPYAIINTIAQKKEFPDLPESGAPPARRLLHNHVAADGMGLKYGAICPIAIILKACLLSFYLFAAYIEHSL
jgi:hypothetical protein